MKRTILTPAQSMWLADTISRNRRYAGMQMMADDPKPEDKPEDLDKLDPKPEDKPEDLDKLGEGGKRAIEAERARAKAAEDQAKALKGEFDGFKAALLEGLGIKPEGDDKNKDALLTVQEELATIKRESAVLKLANTYKISDEKDLKILASATDAEQMKALAERLAPAEEDPDAKSRDRRRPKPDLNQGGGDGGDDQPRGGSVAQVMEERRAARAAKAKTNV